MFRGPYTMMGGSGMAISQITPRNSKQKREEFTGNRFACVIPISLGQVLFLSLCVSCNFCPLTKTRYNHQDKEITTIVSCLNRSSPVMGRFYSRNVIEKVGSDDCSGVTCEEQRTDRPDIFFSLSRGSKRGGNCHACQSHASRFFEWRIELVWFSHQFWTCVAVWWYTRVNVMKCWLDWVGNCSFCLLLGFLMQNLVRINAVNFFKMFFLGICDCFFEYFPCENVRTMKAFWN